MDNSDIALQIFTLVDHGTLLKLHETPLWHIVRPLISNQTFWKMRCEHLVSTQFDRTVLLGSFHVDWRKIYSIVRLCKGFYCSAPSLCWQGSIVATGSIYEYALDDLPTLEVIISIHGLPTRDVLRPSWILRSVTSVIVLSHLLDLGCLDMSDLAQYLCYPSEKGQVNIVTHVLSLLNEQCDMSYTAMRAVIAGQVATTALILPRLDAVIKSGLLTCAVERGDIDMARLLLEDGSKASVPVIKIAIKRGHNELIVYLLRLVNIRSKSAATLLRLALKIGLSMFELVFSHSCLGRIILHTEAIVELLSRAYDWQPTRIRGLLLVGDLTIGQLHNIVTEADFYSKLISYLVAGYRRGPEIIDWLGAQEPSALCLEAVASVLEDRLPTLIEAEPLRALLLVILYRGVSISRQLDLLIEEGMDGSSLEIARRLMGSYVGTDWS